MLKIGTLSKKGIIIMNNDEAKQLMELLDAALNEQLIAAKMLDTLPDASEQDPFKGARFYVGNGAAHKAHGYLEAAIKLLTESKGS